LIQFLKSIQKKTYENYFYPETIKLKNKYQNIAYLFIQHIKNTHLEHVIKAITHPSLTTLCRNKININIKYFIFAIITIIVPTPNLCETKSQTKQHNTLTIAKIKKKKNTLITTPTSINKEIYNYITKPQISTSKQYKTNTTSNITSNTTGKNNGMPIINTWIQSPNTPNCISSNKTKTNN
jgi:hypothetical protein